jgi:hypothetical protein
MCIRFGETPSLTLVGECRVSQHGLRRNLSWLAMVTFLGLDYTTPSFDILPHYDRPNRYGASYELLRLRHKKDRCKY